MIENKNPRKVNSEGFFRINFGFVWQSQPDLSGALFPKRSAGKKRERKADKLPQIILLTQQQRNPFFSLDFLFEFEVLFRADLQNIIHIKETQS